MSEALYRLLTVALCITTAVPAPQNTKDDTNITYVNQEPDIRNQPTTNTTSSESKIQNIPLTIPYIDKNTNQAAGKSDEVNSNYPDKVSSEIVLLKGNNDTGDKLNATNETRDNVNLPDPILTQSNNTEIIATESRQTETISRPLSGENQTDHLASESRQFDKRIGDTTPSYEDAITLDDVLEEVTVITVADEETTKTPPAKLLPKLSHYGKATFGSHSNNLIGGSGKRRFRSRCKCEKIWNCNKLQISVPRCPEEYFLCCS